MTQAAPTPLTLFNSLTRSMEEFTPLHPGEARVYSCGPTVYNYQHIGNMRAYVFADTLGRVLSFKGYKLTHVINITDVGHLTSDADLGEDKMEKMAASSGQSAWDIAAFYQADFEADLARLNIRKPAHPRATEYVDAMIAWAKSIEAEHCYLIDEGLYFDTTTIPDYGHLAGTTKLDQIEFNESAHMRISEVEGKRHAADFAIWRRTPPGETRQMEWDSPWGCGAPGWHLECSVMSKVLLGHPFDIHTGGIDHREIHHPNEIAQNQAHNCSEHSGASIWMHNNFLIERSGKMSKSSGEFLRLQLLVDKGIHPLAYRLMCLQAHYRSELEFSWDNLLAALVRLKRLVMAVERLTGETQAAAIVTHVKLLDLLAKFDAAISDDLNTALALTHFEQVVQMKKIDPAQKLAAIAAMDEVLGLNLLTLRREDLRVRPANCGIEESAIEQQLHLRTKAKADKNFPAADAIRNELVAQGVEVMDGDALGWEWKIQT